MTIPVTAQFSLPGNRYVNAVGTANFSLPGNTYLLELRSNNDFYAGPSNFSVYWLIRPAKV